MWMIDLIRGHKMGQVYYWSRVYQRKSTNIKHIVIRWKILDNSENKYDLYSQLILQKDLGLEEEYYWLRGRLLV